MIKHLKNVIKKNNLKKFKEDIDNISFPFYLQVSAINKASIKDKDGTWYTEYTDKKLSKSNNKKETYNDCLFEHCILVRKENRDSVGAPPNGINSNWADLFINIFQDFCAKEKITQTELYRISVNLTFANGYKQCRQHQDHPYDHRQLIVYLNNADPISKTIILNNKNKIIKKITPKENTGVFFDNKPHYHIYPKKGYRMVAIFTFK